MLIFEAWLNSHPWKVNEKVLQNFSKDKNFIERYPTQLDENEIKRILSKCILDELDEKVYNRSISIQLSQNISQKLREQLADKYKSYKIILQVFVGNMSNESIPNFDSKILKLYTSYYFNSTTDRCISITHNNGNM